jgi:hypothetical protein
VRHRLGDESGFYFDWDIVACAEPGAGKGAHIAPASD